MTKQEEKLKAILASRAFEELNPYHDPQSWEVLSSNEKELLALLFVKQGESQLVNGDQKVFESFKKAEALAPKSPVVYLHQAMAYATQDENIRCLEAASKSLEKVVQIEPTLPAAWHGWGFVTTRKGVFFNEIEYFYDADKKYREAEQLAQQQGIVLPKEFHWHWAGCWWYIGKLSGEAVDYFSALEKFRKAQAEGCVQPEFHLDIAKLLDEIATLVDGKKEFLIEAVENYKKAINEMENQYLPWFCLAVALVRLFDATGDRGYFADAEIAFRQASEIGYDDPLLWHRWGEMYIIAGRLFRDIEKIQTAISKFETALTFEPEDDYVILRWAEAEMLLGAYTENLELLQEAKGKIARCVDRLPLDCNAWYTYGVCLSELGRYFHDREYYLKAAEVFEKGISLSSRNLHLLHGLAMANYALGDLSKDITYMRKAAENCAKVAENDPELPPTFYNDWGVILLKIGEMTNDKAAIEAAAAKFERAINKRIDVHVEDVELEWLYNYGCAMDFLGDFQDEPIYYEKAIQVLSHILQIDPGYYYAKFNLALAFYHLGDLNADIECLQHSIDLFHELVLEEPEDELSWNDYGMSVMSLAVLTNDPISHEKSQQLFEQAEAKFIRAVALGNIDSYYNLGCLYALTNNPPAALHYLEKAERAGAIPSADTVLHDEWLENLRNDQGFRQFISKLLNKEADWCEE